MKGILEHRIVARRARWLLAQLQQEGERIFVDKKVISIHVFKFHTWSNIKMYRRYINIAATQCKRLHGICIIFTEFIFTSWNKSLPEFNFFNYARVKNINSSVYINIYETLRALFSNVICIPCIFASSGSPARKYVYKYPRNLWTWNSTETFAQRFHCTPACFFTILQTKISPFLTYSS